jgi:hypothetical protein
VSRGGGAAELVDRLAAVITVADGRRAGDPETRIGLDHLIPSPDALGSGPARWRLSTSQRCLYPSPVSREPLRAWHAADGVKGRRLLATGLAADRRVVALLSWHFELGPQRPHLVTSAAVRSGVPEPVRAEYLIALWLLLCVGLAIHRRTVGRGRIGLVLDNAIELTPDELEGLGLTRGSARDGYRGDYLVFAARPR